MSKDAIAKALEQLDALIVDAREGSIVPVRLPKQLEAIRSALADVKEPAAPSSITAAAPVEQEAFLKEQAYFIGHAIHELRTPMTSIRGYSDMLANPAMGELSEMQRQFVETIRANAKRMEALLQDVADMNKIRAGTLRMTPKMDIFKNIALLAEQQIKPTVDLLNRTLTMDIPSGLPLLNLDGEMLAKALIKLLDNALRYQREDGDHEVTLRAAAIDGKVQIVISDHGIGMKPEDLERLGTLYFRSEDERVRAHKGSGLGIPIAYGIIRLIGGTISVSSEYDRGTTFTLTIDGIS